MRQYFAGLALLLLPGCASLGLGSSGPDEPQTLWNQAHAALAMADFEMAAPAFLRLSREYPETDPGRESLFYLGSIHLDPRNTAWNPAPADTLLSRYLAADSPEQRVHRRPEAETLLRLAQQLNMPAEDRMPGLQPETKVVRVPDRVVVPARESRALASEVERLKRQVAERDATIQQQKEELERIRKTLTGKGQ